MSERTDIRNTDSFDALLQELENYPSQYVGSEPNVDRVTCFIRGWLFGRGGHVYEAGHHFLSEFREFLLDRLEISRGYGYDWESLIILGSSNSPAGVRHLFRMIHEFRRSKGDQT
ncbi:hypothetical protein C5Y93_04305 [Blastopirellula marina]|uniref:Uncharacterized protein n=1 Tax=Blastopirellula marina TaxID=124 RepID=A0A2S8GS71_9BACT|nr:hypothetical protein C5Y93_04305 [Blastopirellula marina]